MSTEKKLSTIIQSLYFLFGALCICVSSGYSYAFIGISLFSLSILVKDRLLPSIDIPTKRLIIVLIAYPIIQAISIIADNGTIKEFDRPSRALFAILILLLAIRFKPRFSWLMNGFSTGAILAGLRAIYDREIYGFSRAFEWMMPIQGGDISIALGMISFCAAMWAIKESKKYLCCFYFLGFILGVYGSLLSQSRGGWVLFPFIILITYNSFKDWIPPSVKKILLILPVAFSISLFNPHSDIIKRINDTKDDISSYLSNKDKDTSLGNRFELWKSATYSFIEKPIFGWGNHSVRISQKEHLNKNLITPHTYEMNTHAHNQFLDEMAKRGVIGLASLLFLFIYPLYLFKQKIRSNLNIKNKTIAVSGVATILSCIDFSLSQAFLSHNSGIVFYLTSLVLLYCCLYSDECIHQDNTRV